MYNHKASSFTYINQWRRKLLGGVGAPLSIWCSSTDEVKYYILAGCYRARYSYSWVHQHPEHPCFLRHCINAHNSNINIIILLITIWCFFLHLCLSSLWELHHHAEKKKKIRVYVEGRGPIDLNDRTTSTQCLMTDEKLHNLYTPYRISATQSHKQNFEGAETTMYNYIGIWACS